MNAGKDETRSAGFSGRKELREDLQKEYSAIVDAIAGFDQRLMTVKEWSVTLSLAALGLGFKDSHYSYFALGSITALAFWVIDALAKRHQVRYYARMRDLEVAAYQLNNVELPSLGQFSTPKMDWYWECVGSPGGEQGYAAALGEPERRKIGEMQGALLPIFKPHVFLPHLVAVVLGLLLLIGALANVSGLENFNP